MIHVIIGTKAQTIKMAPVIHACRRRGLRCRLIDTGQHGRATGALREVFELPEPERCLAPKRDVSRLAHGVRWSVALACLAARSREHLLREVFADRDGLVLLHGDNASTALGSLLAKRAGLPVALVEAGLRSRNLFHPFPEEILRTVLPRLSDVLFAPSAQAADNLRRMRVRGRVVVTGGNTIIDALGAFVDPGWTRERENYGLWNCHRIENLFHPSRLTAICRLICRAAQTGPVRFVVDVPTRPRLERSGWWPRLQRAGVELVPLMEYPDFLRMLARSRYVATDGGTIQEECAALGVPCLLLRKHTERSDGLGENAVFLDALVDPAVFFERPEAYRRPALQPSGSPAERIADTLQALVN